MDGMIATAATVGLVLAFGLFLGLLNKRQFSMRWLLTAALLVIVNDAALTSFYGMLPDFIGGEWNWQGKILALATTLAIAVLPAIGWKQIGLTFNQAHGSMRAALPVSMIYCTFFVAIALAFPSNDASTEVVAFQLTMPGFEEEPFYRGLLLFALDRAFTGRKRILGVEWGWGALLSCMLFGMVHAFGFSGGGFSFEPVTMALTAVPSFIGIWLRVRTGSLLLPVLLHNFGNALSFFI